MTTPARVSGHRLSWMAVTRAKCECGRDLRVSVDEIAGKPNVEVHNMLMDLHSAHLAKVKERRG